MTHQKTHRETSEDALPPEGDEVAPDATVQPPPAEAPGLEEQLRLAEQKAQEREDAWLRAKAEADNTRKRAQEEIAKASRFSLEGFATALLPVKDSLEAALATENTTVEQIRAGVEVTLKQLQQALAKENVHEINPVNDKFDPHQHQAIAALPSDKDPNQVINVLQKGYRLHDRILRPALVTVAKAKDG